eukprot:7387402-Prymnesium_polylepis.1
MRRYMLSPEGNSPAAQQTVLVRTLRRLMTPVLPPFYRIFMGGIVPSTARGDPQWLEDAAQRLVRAIDRVLPVDAKEALAPGKQLGPAPYAPLLTSVVAPCKQSPARGGYRSHAHARAEAPACSGPRARVAKSARVE